LPDGGFQCVQWHLGFALDLPHWAMPMCSAPYRLIRMAIKMASEAAAFFSVVDYLSCITVAK
jgi:hypothetical protein